MMNIRITLMHINRYITGTLYAMVILQIQQSLSGGSPSPRSARIQLIDTPDDRYEFDDTYEPADRYEPGDRCKPGDRYEPGDRLAFVAATVAVVFQVVAFIVSAAAIRLFFLWTAKDTSTSRSGSDLCQLDSDIFFPLASFWANKWSCPYFPCPFSSFSTV